MCDTCTAMPCVLNLSQESLPDLLQSHVRLSVAKMIPDFCVSTPHEVYGVLFLGKGCETSRIRNLSVTGIHYGFMTMAQTDLVIHS